MGESNKSERDIDKAIGAKIRLARLDRGMSQGALGEKIELTFQQVQKYERGASRISASKLVRLAGELGREPQWFVAGIADFAPATGGQTLGLAALASTPEGMDLLKAFARIQSTMVRRRVAQLAAALADEDLESS